MKFLPFKANFKLEDVLDWEIVTDTTIREALINEALQICLNTYDDVTIEELEALNQAGRLKADIYIQPGDGYMLDGDPDENVYYDQYFIVELSEKGETE